MMMRIAGFIFMLALGWMCMVQISAQVSDSVFRRPLDIPVSLSATFAELRANHFHSGIDYRTQGTTGHPVHAAESGSVVRIAVSPTGYGHALYIRHPNGYTSVYGHLESFSSQIAAWVKRQQYHQKRFAVNLFPSDTLFRIQRGEVIGLSGNTGGSSGPHLHFELRETRTEKPVNPLQFGLGVRDHTPPILHRLAVYPADSESSINGGATRQVLYLEKQGNTYRIADGKRISVTGTVAFGIQTWDLISGSANHCGPYKISLRIDSTEVFTQTMDKFSFDETRYVNSLIDYAFYINHNSRINRMYIEPNNRLGVYGRHTNRGWVSFPDAGIHHAHIIVSDYHGNSSHLRFAFAYAPAAGKNSSARPSIPNVPLITSANRASYRTRFTYANGGMQVVIPAGALYDEIDFTCTTAAKPKNLYSTAYRIQDPGTPLHRPITIDIDAVDLPTQLRAKALIVQIDSTGKPHSAGGAYRDGTVHTTSSVFGTFAIGVDTIAPRISALNIRDGANMKGISSIRFKITDDFSGISTYSGQIDGQWVLFEYDAKTGLLFYTFDPERLTQNTQHTLNLKITDSKGNAATCRAKFTW